MNKTLLAFGLLAACLSPALRAENDEPAPLHRSFGWQVQFNQPVKDFRTFMDTKTGLGLGVQWQHYRGNGLAERTRLEWNIFGESPEVGPHKTRTTASNVILSFDRIFYMRVSGLGPYVTGGLGVVHWILDETKGTHTDRWRTNKLNVMAGLGFQLTRHLAIEGRYQVSSVRSTMDGNSVQVSATLRY